MERIVEQAFLYDFYGELLTEHQRQIYEDFVLNDLSLSEIAGEQGISRQGVHDLIRRCNKILEGYESKLHLVEKFLDTKHKVEQMHQVVIQAKQCEEQHQKVKMYLSQLEGLAEDILEHL